MSGELTQAGANRAVAAGVGQAQSAAAGMYLMLLTALPGSPESATLATFAGTELATAGYSRKAVTWSAPSGDPSQIANASAVNFGTFSADPPSVGYCALVTASTGTSGDVLAYWTLDAARDAASGDSLQFSAGQLTISVD